MTKIKICGLSRTEDIEYANICKPDYIGFVFAPSKRRIDAEKATMLREQLMPGIKCVGVFVNADIGFLGEICSAGIIDLVQLHGDEDAEYIRKVKRITQLPVIKAVQVGEELNMPSGEPDYFMFDAPSTSARGGSGETFDWNMIGRYEGDYFLAGGLNPENVEAAIRKLKPFCVDVSSGVETEGKKDFKKMRDFVMAVRGCDDGR
jgi:phosphoribosylanthranilate isomerase